jgi:ATP-dependent Clp protease ATP-binding subunit ClpX
MENIRVRWDKTALDYIVEQALAYNLGARGLRSICEAIIKDAMFDLPSQPEVREFTVSLDYAQEKFGQSGAAEWRAAA